MNISGTLWSRYLIGIPIAIAITTGLFMFMEALIRVDEVRDEVVSTRTLKTINPEDNDLDVRERQRSKPKKIESSAKPPPPPKLSVTKADVNLPAASFEGAAPSDLNFSQLDSLSINPIIVSDRDAKPIRPPLPTYPRRMQERGVEGNCDVRFDVDIRGKPYNIQAECSNSGFRSEAIRAVSRVEFAPKLVRGKPVARGGVVYPLVFKLEEG